MTQQGRIPLRKWVLRAGIRRPILQAGGISVNSRRAEIDAVPCFPADHASSDSSGTFRPASKSRERA
jgi:hypothetical protein